MRALPKLLSKSKLMRGYRCLKCIYLTIHRPDLEPPITPELQALFDQGNEVGTVARTYFPGGVLIDNVPWDFTGAIKKTQALIAAGVETIYEAAFSYQGYYARADIIQYSPTTKRWQIYEVKSTTKVKPEHLDDAGLQTWIMAKTGLPIEKIHIMHLNSACRYPDLSNLFLQQDITEELRARYRSVQPQLTEIVTTLQSPTIPDIDLGAHCLSPTECQFTDFCWKEKNIPEVSVLNLPGIKNRKWELYAEGILALDDPRLTDLTELQQRVVDVTQSGERYINSAAIQAELSTWQYPLVFLDFETIGPAIPCYDGCKPYQQVPFQFSVHRQSHPDADIQHDAHLHDQPDDPRPALIPALLAACGKEGSIVAYYAPFESERIRELASFAPEYADDLLKLLDRMVDPLPLIKDHVYDVAFAGSFSLKSVAPALLGESQSYNGMLVANGGDAQRAYKELIASSTNVARKAKLREAMLEYCNKDTWVMVELVRWLLSQH